MSNTCKAKASKEKKDFPTQVLSLLDEGQSKKAESLFQAAWQRNPNSNQLVLLKGDMLRRLEGIGAARSYYASLLDRESIAQWVCGRLLTLLREDAPPPGEAEDIIRRLGTTRADGRVRTQLLDILIAREDPPERRKMLEIAVASTSLPRYRVKLAIQRAEENNFADAMQLLAEAHRVPEAPLQTATLLADLLTVEGRLPEAIAIIEEQIKKSPDQPDLYRRLTMLLQRARNFAAAADAFEMAVRRWPHDWMLAYRLYRLPIERERMRAILEIMSRGAEEALRSNGHFRLFFARNLLNVGEIERGLALLRMPFEEASASLVRPLLAALAARSDEHWVRGSRLVYDRTKEVQITRSNNARATFVLPMHVAFGTLPHAFVDTLFADHNVNVIYLSGFGKFAFLKGIHSLGDDESTTIDGLRCLLDEIGTRRTIVMGTSGGGFAAMRYGALLAADTAVSFGGQSNLSAWLDGTKVSVYNPDFFARAAMAREPDLPVDLVPLLSRRWPTKFLQVYAPAHAEDARQALRLAGIPGVTLWPIYGALDHFVADYMIGDGSFDTLLEDLIEGRPVTVPERES
jgi:tetratricopeptide (TPR) repeat protein